jgi:hypothetical protein
LKICWFFSSFQIHHHMEKKPKKWVYVGLIRLNIVLHNKQNNVEVCWFELTKRLSQIPDYALFLFSWNETTKCFIRSFNTCSSSTYSTSCNCYDSNSVGTNSIAEKENIFIDYHFSRESEDDDDNGESTLPTPLIDLNKINIKRHNKSVCISNLFLFQKNFFFSYSTIISHVYNIIKFFSIIANNSDI